MVLVGAFSVIVKSLRTLVWSSTALGPGPALPVQCNQCSKYSSSARPAANFMLFILYTKWQSFQNKDNCLCARAEVQQSAGDTAATLQFPWLPVQELLTLGSSVICPIIMSPRGRSVLKGCLIKNLPKANCNDVGQTLRSELVVHVVLGVHTFNFWFKLWGKICAWRSYDPCSYWACPVYWPGLVGELGDWLTADNCVSQ